MASFDRSSWRTRESPYVVRRKHVVSQDPEPGTEVDQLTMVSFWVDPTTGNGEVDWICGKQPSGYVIRNTSK